MANYAWDNTSSGSTFEVAQTSKSVGLFDIYGNAREYCLDYADLTKPESFC